MERRGEVRKGEESRGARAEERCGGERRGAERRAAGRTTHRHRRQKTNDPAKLWRNELWGNFMSLKLHSSSSTPARPRRPSPSNRWMDCMARPRDHQTATSRRPAPTNFTVKTIIATPRNLAQKTIFLFFLKLPV